MAGPTNDTVQVLAADAAADLMDEAIVGQAGAAQAGSTLAQRVMLAMRLRDDGVVQPVRKPASVARPVTDRFWPIASDLKL